MAAGDNPKGSSANGVDSCKSREVSDTGCAPPWAGDRRPDDKTRILRTACFHARNTPQGVPFPDLLDAVFGDDWEPNGSNYMLAYRLINRHPDLFEKSKPYGDMVWVHPTDDAVSLIRSMQSFGTGGESAPGRLRLSGLPRDRAERFLSSTARATTDRQKGLAVKFLAYHRGTVGGDNSDKWVSVGRDEGGRRWVQAGEQRFTSAKRAGRVRAKYEALCDAVEADHDVATWATYTLPRECVPSVYESVDVIRSGLSTLHDRFRHDPKTSSKPSRPGYVPPYLTVLEAQRDMVAHLHVVYAGERRLMDVHDLRRDWGDVIDAPPSKPPQINLRPLSIGSDGWRVNRVDDEAYGDIRDYHRDGLRRLATLTEISHGELHDRADRLLAGDGTDDDRNVAGLVLLWATGARFTTAGGGLQPSTSTRSTTSTTK